MRDNVTHMLHNCLLLSHCDVITIFLKLIVILLVPNNEGIVSNFMNYNLIILKGLKKKKALYLSKEVMQGTDAYESSICYFASDICVELMQHTDVVFFHSDASDVEPMVNRCHRKRINRS